MDKIKAFATKYNLILTLILKTYLVFALAFLFGAFLYGFLSEMVKKMPEMCALYYADKS